MKLSFNSSTEWGVIAPEGDYDLPVASELGHRFQLVEGKVVDKYNGVSDDEVKALDIKAAETAEAEALDAERKALVTSVKIEAGDRINGLNWKVDRAKERDALNGTETVKDVYAEREAIRTASDEAETAIGKLETLEEIATFTW